MRHKEFLEKSIENESRDFRYGENLKKHLFTRSQNIG